MRGRMEHARKKEGCAVEKDAWNKGECAEERKMRVKKKDAR